MSLSAEAPLELRLLMVDPLEGVRTNPRRLLQVVQLNGSGALVPAARLPRKPS